MFTGSESSIGNEGDKKMKSKVTINMDSFLLDEAKQYRINISQSAEEAVQSKIGILKGDASTVDKRLLIAQIEKTEKKAVKINVELVELRQQMKGIEEYESKKEETKLIKEKKAIEQQAMCSNCGLQIATKSHKFPIGLICNACFMCSNATQFNKWNQVKP